MAIKKRTFRRGVIVKPDDVALEGIEGEIKVGETSGKLEAHLEGVDREVTTNDQTQTLENKTIDGTAATGNNTVTADADNISYDNAVSGLTATDVKAAIDELDAAIEGQNEASEIQYDNATSGLTATNVQDAIDEVEGRVDTIEGATYVNSFNGRTGAVTAASSDYDAVQVDYDNTTSGLTATDTQAAIDEVEGRLDTAESNISTNTGNISTNNTLITDHIADAVDAHDASAISNVPAGNLAATDVQGALNELQSDVDTRALDSDLTAHLNDAVDAHDASAISNVPAGNLAATDVQGALNELQTDIDTRATDADLTAHTGASSGVHGVTGNVVGTTDTQTLTNKTIQGASIETPTRLDVKQDTKANLEVYATTATNGQIVFATDEKRMYQIVDNALVEVGAGGAGSLNSFYQETFEDNDNTIYTTTGSWTKGDETTNPLRGTRSLLLTQVSGSAGATQTLTTGIVLEDDQIGTLVGFSGRYLAANGSNYRVRILESSDDIIYTEVATVDLEDSATAKSFQVVGTTLSTSTHLKYEFEVLTESIADTIIFDSLEFETEPLPIVNFDSIKNTESFTPTGSYTTNATYTGFKQKIGDKYKYQMKISFSGATDSGALTFNVPDGTIDIAKMFAESDNRLMGQAVFHDASQPKYYALRVKYLNDSTVELVYFDDDAPYEELLPFQNASISTFASGDEIILEFEVPIVGLSAQGSGVVTQQTVTEGEWESVSVSGSWSNVSYSAIRRKIGQNYEYQYEVDVNSGAPTGSALTLNLPSGDVIDTTKLISSGGGNYEELGSGNALDSGTNTYTNKVLYNNTTSVVVFNELSGSTYLVNQNQTTPTVPFTFTTGDKVVVKFSVPIVGLEAIEKNVTVISPFKTEIATGTEYLTGEVIDGKRVYEYVYEVPTTITGPVSANTVVDVSSLSVSQPVGHVKYFSTGWLIDSAHFDNGAGTNFGFILYYDDSVEEIRVTVEGTWELGAGTILRFKYTK